MKKFRFVFNYMVYGHVRHNDKIHNTEIKEPKEPTKEIKKDKKNKKEKKDV